MTYMPRAVFAMIGVLSMLAGSCAEPSLSVDEYAAVIGEETDAYISEAQTLSITYQRTVQDQITALADQGKADLLSRAASMAAGETVQYLVLLEDAMMRYRNGLEMLNPPSVLAERHGAYREAIASVESSMQATRDAVGGASDLDAIQVAITGSGFNDGQLRLRATCTALEAAVRAEGRSLDLGCTRPSAVVGGS
jgi:hypothetical protein